MENGIFPGREEHKWQAMSRNPGEGKLWMGWSVEDFLYLCGWNFLLYYHEL